MTIQDRRRRRELRSVRKPRIAAAIALLALVLGVLITSTMVRAQSVGRTARVGYLGDATQGPEPAGLIEAFREGLRKHGWVEGQNLVIERRYAANPEQRREISAEMERLKVDVVVAAPASAFVIRPAGSAPMVREVQTAAKALNVMLSLFEIAAEDPVTKIDAAFASMADQRAQAVLGLQGPHYFRERHRIADLSLRHRLPGIFEHSPYVEAGCLMSYSPSLADIWRRGAAYVDKILKGAHPSDLPVEQPTGFELVVNLKTARTFGVSLPPSFLSRADRIIE